MARGHQPWESVLLVHWNNAAAIKFASCLRSANFSSTRHRFLLHRGLAQCGHFLHLASSSQRLRWLDAANQVRKDLKVRSDPRGLQDLLDRLVLLGRKVPRVSKGLLGRKVPLAQEER